MVNIGVPRRYLSDLLLRIPLQFSSLYETESLSFYACVSMIQNACEGANARFRGPFVLCSIVIEKIFVWQRKVLTEDDCCWDFLSSSMAAPLRCSSQRVREIEATYHSSVNSRPARLISAITVFRQISSIVEYPNTSVQEGGEPGQCTVEQCDSLWVGGIGAFIGVKS